MPRHLLDGFDFTKLFAAKCILNAADRVLNLSGNLFAFAFSFKLGITRNLADDFFYDTFGLLCRSLDAVFIHVKLPFHDSSELRTRIWAISFGVVTV